MTDKQLKEAKELSSLIETTQNAIRNLTNVKPDKRDSQAIYDDKLFNLCICEHSDGSGFKAKLSRYNGNLELLNVIIETLEGQLYTYQKKFKEL